MVLMEKTVKLQGYDNKIIFISEEALQGVIGEDETVEEFLDTYTYDDAEYLFEYDTACKVLGYFIDRDDQEAGVVNGATVFVAVDEGYSDRLTYYSPIGQHSESHRDYLDRCIEITKEEYLKAAGPNGTPNDYL
jgi:hypothetical protein